MAFQNVALIGGTGAVGSHVLDALLSSFTASSITVLTRKSSKTHSYPQGVKVIALPSYTDHDTVISALRGQDVLISALSTTVLNLEPKLVELAIEAGVKRFMPSEYTVDVVDWHYRNTAKTPTAKMRVQWADRLAEIGREGKIEYTTIVPGPFVDYCLETSFWPFDVGRKAATIYDGGDTQRTGCSLRFTGECVATALQMPEAETRNRRIRVSEVYYSGKKIVEELERATDAKWYLDERPLDDLNRKEDEELKKGNPEQAYFAFVVRNNFDDSPAGMLEDGFDSWRTGELKIDRRPLAVIVDEVVNKATMSVS
ncbi:MAG: hypothetical protein Q9217_002442 [Psora testacea]